MAHISESDEHLVHAYLDEELDIATALMVESKIAADPTLQQLARDIGALKMTLAEKFPSEPLPFHLRQRIYSSIVPAHRKKWQSRWTLAAASVLLAVALSGALTLTQRRDSGLSSANSELVDAHLRALMATQPIDVASTDQHTVKPWFNGRIPQAPRVIDLHEHGFDLVGGRIDVVNNTPLPTLVYRRRQHVISLTEAAANASSAAFFTTHAKNGFNVIGWSEGGRSYVAISDLNADELKSFMELFRTAT
jgi:anti-sigma factor RsiW